MLNKNFTIRTSTEVHRRWVYEMDALLDEIDTDVVVLLDETDLANEESLDFDAVDLDERQAMNRVLQQLRGVIQIRNEPGKRKLSFLAAGVAASIFTSSVRFGRDNQLFGFASARPLGPMSRDEMREMVRVLGKRSGLRFDDHRLFDSLFAEYGGHPHLTRQACARVATDVYDRQSDRRWIDQSCRFCWIPQSWWSFSNRSCPTSRGLRVSASCRAAGWTVAACTPQTS